MARALLLNKIKMNKKLGVLLAFFSIQLGASANTLTFDDIAPNSRFQYLGPAAYDGFLFNATSLTINVTTIIPYFGSGPAHGGKYALLNNNGGNIEITGAAGEQFRLGDVWIRSWYDWKSGTRSVLGYDGENLVFSVPFTLQQTWTEVIGNDQNITKLVFAGWPAFFLIDDLTLNPVPKEPLLRVAVPEQTNTLSVLGVGLTALSLVAHRLTRLQHAFRAI